ncbi:hypothetical protein MUK42_03219 [Musa troglodytarum]|uniref:Uncharacterized protein n=1 Tax=Musa troglodytarum TaxID=320322 RepID=A0A9E7EL81_9LILI|nr:hypothetical protein MUK42_03219 [Musa troglodytarum]
MPCDDYYYDTASLVANYSHHDARRSSDVATIRESISFHTMIKEDISGSGGCDEASLPCHGPSLMASKLFVLINVQLKSQKQAAYISGYHATRMMIVSGHADAIVNVRHANLMDVVALQHNAY